MRKFRRDAAPGYLAEHWEAWGDKWANDRASGTAFYWHVVDGERLNRKLLPILKALTQGHCAFCDQFPVSPPSVDTIEHFRPKSKFPNEAFRWENLYFCCSYCQAKGDEFDELVLQPDDINYEFERYFMWDFTLGTLEANQSASPTDQERAKATIRVYRLNEGHPSLRRRALSHRARCRDFPLDDFPYRLFVGE
jgi:uncharacterized protein (TIGR02646 family)